MKPNPKVFQMACDICGVDKSNAVMIGDSYKDDYLPSKDFGIGRSYLLNRKGGDGFKSLNDI
ncbi:MAG: HAD hydrolase-like protein [Saprospiraceae bacterium]|nr:HAD hydrolase-like protein [Saprospiraceae bacterium]